MTNGNVEIHLVELEMLDRDDEAALASLTLTLRLASSNVVRAAERLIDPGQEAAQAAIQVSALMTELAAAIEDALLRSLEDAQ